MVMVVAAGIPHMISLRGEPGAWQSPGLPLWSLGPPPHPLVGAKFMMPEVAPSQRLTMTELLKSYYVALKGERHSVRMKQQIHML